MKLTLILRQAQDEGVFQPPPHHSRAVETSNTGLPARRLPLGKRPRNRSRHWQPQCSVRTKQRAREGSVSASSAEGATCRVGVATTRYFSLRALRSLLLTANEAQRQQAAPFAQAGDARHCPKILRQHKQKRPDGILAVVRGCHCGARAGRPTPPAQEMRRPE